MIPRASSLYTTTIKNNNRREAITEFKERFITIKYLEGIVISLRESNRIKNNITKAVTELKPTMFVKKSALSPIMIVKNNIEPPFHDLIRRTLSHI
ncbi:MAG: hypothetical protein GWO20_13395 [Candidatus Korarchaeota archaeon]|nr:hypothetical protein [Candidatus Korarchaeota archaeon]NIU84388.1 hypothetical protein [Candidatus Thorarchaeota archaeon]NIW14496.1 hypothetical protein [Candidatus Thorarchaeota archaeon]NIW52576.1 hypothetical protein [Candidatus Korarchaeota archaeon]